MDVCSQNSYKNWKYIYMCIVNTETEKDRYIVDNKNAIIVGYLRIRVKF